MKYFYFSTGVENIAVQRRYVEFLETKGWKQSYDWTVNGVMGPDLDAKSGAQAIKPSVLIQKELEGVERAQVVLVRLPGGRGTHTELGAALALRKPVLLLHESEEALLLDGRMGASYTHPLVLRMPCPIAAINPSKAHLQNVLAIMESMYALKP